jgi:predicted RNase H-related nuclease YkuK (DUF458 family)
MAMAEKRKKIILAESIPAKFIEEVEYDSIATLKWRTLSGEYLENLETYLQNMLENNIKAKNHEYKFVVSADSQRVGKHIVYVIAIVVLNEGHGGRAFYLREKEEIEGFIPLHKDVNKKVHDLKMQNVMRRRLWNECVKSVKCAIWLDKILENYGFKVNEIHSDISKNKKYKSSELAKAITGYVEASGYVNVLKPDAWAASSIANWKTK